MGMNKNATVGQPNKTSDLKAALLEADKRVVTIGGERRKLHCCEVNGRFFCDAEVLNPLTQEDAKFCLMDLWRSESDKAAKFLAAFAKLGGYEDSWTAMKLTGSKVEAA